MESIVKIAHMFGRKPASVAEAREIFGLSRRLAA